MNKIVSYSLWGDNEKYTIGAVKNAHLVQSFYPGWIGRFYCGQSVPENILDDLNSVDNTEVIIMNEEGNWEGMFWRFLAADGDDVVISRDTDSRITKREVDAVNEWLNSPHDFHIMRDHPWHGHHILGGMWGSRNGILKDITKWIDDYTKGDYWMVDQNFLRDVVYPKVKDLSMIHDEFFERKSFPTKRIPRQFVGQPFNADDTECDPKHGDLV